MNLSDVNPVFAGGSESYHYMRANEKYSDVRVVSTLAMVMLERKFMTDAYDALGAALTMCRYQRSVFAGERLFYETHMRLNAQNQASPAVFNGGCAQPELAV